MFIRIGSGFIDVTKIYSVKVQPHYDQRDNESWNTLLIEFDPALDLKSVTLTEQEARQSPFLSQFLGQTGYVKFVE